MTPFTAPAKLISKGISAVGGAVGGAAKKVGEVAGKVLKPVGKIVGKIAKPIGDVAGMVAPIATAASFIFPPLAPIAGIADAVSLGAGLAGSASKLIDGDPNTKLGLGDAMPLLSMFP